MSTQPCDIPEISDWFDAGSGVEYKLMYEDGAPITMYYRHGCPKLGDNPGAVLFDVPAHEYAQPESKWQVESFAPLTISPSLLCNACGHHGFLRNGQWIEA